MPSRHRSPPDGGLVHVRAVAFVFGALVGVGVPRALSGTARVDTPAAPAAAAPAAAARTVPGVAANNMSDAAARSLAVSRPRDIYGHKGIFRGVTRY